jgi:hypothetical protein
MLSKRELGNEKNVGTAHHNKRRTMPAQKPL